ncbi:uncharacterized protein LOC120200590 [Hibiscus syriacus]|uniref:uncharacterized protein LOC120200590 n=1 Tax=Hibiscus syriacus TaxID=106335 RepID=UPI0019204C62|nr:uncharacterized protein LOC120200590 [Hibiscus syriacus]
MGNPKKELLRKRRGGSMTNKTSSPMPSSRLPNSRAPPPKCTSLAASPPLPELTTTTTPSRLTLNSVTASSATSSFCNEFFSIDTVVKPLPPAIAYNVSRNLSFFNAYSLSFLVVLDSHPSLRYSCLTLVNVSNTYRHGYGYTTHQDPPNTYPEGIANAQKSLGLGQEEKARRVR